MKIFFCGGPLKSGTTFLQRMLNEHPDIRCQPEHALNSLFLSLLKTRDNYNNLLKEIANVMGTEGPLISQNVFLEGFYQVLKGILSDNIDESFSGLNDNLFIINNANILFERFKDSKIIYVVRNPIDKSLSEWDHYIKLYQRKNIKSDLSFLTTNGKLDKELFVIRNSVKWGKDSEKIKSNFNLHPKRVLIVRYEDLSKNKQSELERIINFLGANSNKEILSEIIKKSSFDFMKKNSTNPDFYTIGRTNFGNQDLSIKTIIESVKNAGEPFDFFRYREDFENLSIKN